MKHKLIIFFIAFLSLPLFPALAAPAPEMADIAPAGVNGPGGQWDGVPARPALKRPEPLWSLRTGFRKGVTDQALDDAAYRPRAGAPYEQPLSIEGPVDVKRSSAPIPRVLIWSGGDDFTAIERAVSAKLQKEAFAGESVYLKTVTSAEDFTNYALTGLYSVYLLLDADGGPDTAEVLRNGLARGRGIILAGSGERMRALAEALDFRFGNPLPGSSGSITFPADSGLGITGTIPVSGRLLPPRKRSARAVATLPDGKPVVLYDVQDKGKVVLLPFSLTRSAQNAGTTELYSLLLRSSVLTAAPENEAPGSIASMQLLVSAYSAGEEKARIIETLPPGAKLVWTSIPCTVKDGALVFELTVEREAKKVLYLFQPAETGGAKTSTEVFTECGGKFVSQGKIE
jgi:hypothetical protein